MVVQVTQRKVIMKTIYGYSEVEDKRLNYCRILLLFI